MPAEIGPLGILTAGNVMQLGAVCSYFTMLNTLTVEIKALHELVAGLAHLALLCVARDVVVEYGEVMRLIVEYGMIALDPLQRPQPTAVAEAARQAAEAGHRPPWAS